MNETISPRNDRNTSAGSGRSTGTRSRTSRKPRMNSRIRTPATQRNKLTARTARKNEDDEDRYDEDSVNQGHHEQPPSPGRSGHGIRLQKKGRAGFLRLGRRKRDGSKNAHAGMDPTCWGLERPRSRLP